MTRFHGNRLLVHLPRRAEANRSEATAEWLHERVRKEYWGYAAAEALDNAALIKEQYQGIRPAPGYPSCPDHTVKAAMFQLLDAPTDAGMNLTESMAITPAAGVAGFYFAQPKSHCFAISGIGEDQLEDCSLWARRWFLANWRTPGGTRNADDFPEHQYDVPCALQALTRITSNQLETRHRARPC